MGFVDFEIFIDPLGGFFLFEILSMDSHFLDKSWKFTLTGSLSLFSTF